MGKAKRTTRAASKKSPVDNTADSERNIDVDPETTKSRVTFTFEVLRDLIILLCEKEPWRAQYGQTEKVWNEIAGILNDRYNLSPRASARAIRTKASSLRKLQEVSTTI